MAKRAAGFLIFRRLNAQIEYLLLKASYGNKHWTPPKGKIFTCIEIDSAYPTQIDKHCSNEIKSYQLKSPGHVDPGEDDFTTALRETQEEAGYASADLKIFKDEQKILNYKVKGNDKTVVYWLAELCDATKDPILSDEHTEFRWLEKDAAIKLSGYDDFAAMVQHFHDRINSL